GLVATHRDDAGAAVVRLEPTVALHLRASDAPHPRLSAGAGTARWEGHINLTQADSYRFRVHLRGAFKLKIGAKQVLNAESKGDGPALLSGQEVRLEAGVLPIVAELVRPAGAARVEVLWSSKQFREEPLPFDVLGHLPAQAPERLQTDSLAEEGRF